MTSTLAAGPSPTAATDSTRRWVALAIVLSATFMQLLDVSIVNVATRSIQSTLHSSYADVQLVLSGYQLGFASTLITAARLGDVYGRKRLFLLGMFLFTGSSALCGVAVNPGMLVASRVVQGIASGLMFPQVLSVIQVLFPPAERGKAFSAFGATLGLGTILGPVTGGLLIQADLFTDPWRAIFFVNVPIGVVAFTSALRLLPESTAPDRPRLDVTGAVLSAVGLALLVYPLAEGRTRGWPLWIDVMIAVAVLLLAAFVTYERRLLRGDGSPVLDTRLFADRSFRMGSLLNLIFFAGVPAFFLTFSLYLQQGDGFSALGAGLSSFPFAVASAIASARSDVVARRLGRSTLALGAGLLAVGMAGLILTVHLVGVRPHAYLFIPAMLVCGVVRALRGAGHHDHPGRRPARTGRRCLGGAVDDAAGRRRSGRGPHRRRLLRARRQQRRHGSVQGYRPDARRHPTRRGRDLRALLRGAQQGQGPDGDATRLQSPRIRRQLGDPGPGRRAGQRAHLHHHDPGDAALRGGRLRPHRAARPAAPPDGAQRWAGRGRGRDGRRRDGRRRDGRGDPPIAGTRLTPRSTDRAPRRRTVAPGNAPA